MFPLLPGDPPFEETTVFLLLLILAYCTLILLFVKVIRINYPNQWINIIVSLSLFSSFYVFSAVIQLSPLLILIGLVCWGVIILNLEIFKTTNNSTNCLKILMRYSLFGLICLTFTISSRNIGRWGELKQELISYSKDARSYIETYGEIDSDAKLYKFEDMHPVHAFTFEDGTKVYLVYLWWLEPSKVGIKWDGGGTAAFHLPTMFCVYSD